jgi:isopentenyl-diphosphate delta-isomerase
MPQWDEVILVNERDEPIGSMEKMEVHRKALLHRAFSIFIFNGKGDMLLQQRSRKKYHSPGLWTNACCSHPRPGETTHDAAIRRLAEELGFSTELNNIFAFTYRSEFENGLTEFEFDHVFVGVHDGVIVPDPNEVNDYCFKTMEEIQANLGSHPLNYTAWFLEAFPLVRNWQAAQIIRKDSDSPCPAC